MLPVLDYPVADIEISSLKRKVKFRPFLTKEEKILLIAKQSKIRKDILEATCQVCQVCQQEDINIYKLPIFDLLYIFVKLVSFSVSNKIEQSYRDLDDEKIYKVVFNLDELKLEHFENHTKTLKVNDKFTLELQYPSVEDFLTVQSIEDEEKRENALLLKTLDRLYDDERMFFFKDETPEDVLKFIESLPSNTYKDLLTFFNTFPKLIAKQSYTNSKGQVKEIKLDSLDDFFTLALDIPI